MEIKIKNNEELIDATIEVKDGIMIVSPIKKEKYRPKDGDIIFSGLDSVSIFKSFDSIFVRTYCSIYNSKFVGAMDVSLSNIRPATESEKQELFEILKEEGLEWDAENKTLVKIPWRPGFDEKYYAPASPGPYFEAIEFQWKNTETGRSYYNKGWVFKTEQECQAFCDRLNESINQVKP